MLGDDVAETLNALRPYKERVVDEYADWLGYHHVGHMESGFPYLASQWILCDLYGLPVDKFETGLAWINHDRRFGLPGHGGFGSKEARSAQAVAEELVAEGWNPQRIQKVIRPIMATWLDGEITDTNDLVVVRTDLRNIWGPYPTMVTNTLTLRREEERMRGEAISFQDFQKLTDERLSKYLARDMALIPGERLPDGQARPNADGQQNLERFLAETPESLAELLGISVSEVT